MGAPKKGVFISWSGKRSLHAALAFRDLLRVLIPGACPFVSEKDIEAGNSWDDAIRKQAKVAAYCVVCVTSGNLGSQWLHYEAGAMKEGFRIPVAPYLLDLDVAQLHGPLQRMQAKIADKLGTWEILLPIAKRVAPGSDTATIRELFEKQWELFSNELKKMPADTGAVRTAGASTSAASSGEMYSDETVVHLLRDKLSRESTSGVYVFSRLEKELGLPPGSAARNFVAAASEKFELEMAPESVQFKRKPRPAARLRSQWDRGF